MDNSRLTGWRRSSAYSSVLLLATLAWAYYPTFDHMARRWSLDPQYTHGYVVPVFAAVVLWFRRDRVPGVGPGSPWGIVLLVVAGAMRLAGVAFAFEWLDAGSLVPALAGVVLLCFGPRVLLWTWPVAVFMLFVLPLPWQLDNLLTYPLRRIATVCSTYVLQTVGVPALATGNIIVINKREIGVVDACSGLGMLMTFFALSTAVAFVIRRPLGERLVVFASAVPIGVLMNIGRITLTVFLYQVTDEDLAKVVFHDVAGWIMMPAALVLLWLELLWLSRLWRTVDSEPARPIAVVSEATPEELPGWLRRQQAESEIEVKFNPCLEEMCIECRPNLPSATPPPSESLSKQAKADRPLQEIPDVAC